MMSTERPYYFAHLLQVSKISLKSDFIHIFSYFYAGIPCKINLAIVFVCIRFITSGFYGQIIASRYMRRSLEKESPVKNRNICTSVKSVFKTGGR